MSAQPTVQEPKERPAIFTSQSVRAILAGTKSQTRRVVKISGWLAKHECRLDHAWADPGLGDGGYLKVPHRHRDDPPNDNVRDWAVERVRCPFGIIGDRIWVKEAFALSALDPDSGLDLKRQSDWDSVIYRATPESGGWVRYEDGAPPQIISPPWRSPLFMPRWASRLVLEITSIRAERLHEITEADAIAEGIERNDGGTFYVRGEAPERAEFHDARTAFSFGWDGINGNRAPWESNPWVFAIGFRRIT